MPNLLIALLVAVAFVVWISQALVAMWAGPDRYSVRLFWLTFLFLGALGVAAALIMTAIDDNAPGARGPLKRKPARGRQRFTCPRCAAENDIPDADKSYDCWRCGEQRNVKPKTAPAAG